MMDQGDTLNLVIRKTTISETEEMYRVTLLKRIESMDELLSHPRIAALIDGRAVRMEKIDNYRFKIFLSAHG
jgi:hypothetical protein